MACEVRVAGLGPACRLWMAERNCKLNHLRGPATAGTGCGSSSGIGKAGGPELEALAAAGRGPLADLLRRRSEGASTDNVPCTGSVLRRLE